MKQVPLVVELFDITAHAVIYQLNNEFKVEDFEQALANASEHGRDEHRMLVIVSVDEDRVERSIAEILRITGVNAVWQGRRTPVDAEDFE